MFIVFEKPTQKKAISDNETMAININAYDSITISRITNTWYLSLETEYNSNEDTEGTLYYKSVILKESKSYTECLELFENLIQSISSGKKVFKIPINRKNVRNAKKQRK